MPLPHSGSFKKGDPRAVAAGKKGTRTEPEDLAARKAQETFERLIQNGIKLPEGFTPPSNMEIQELARALMPAVLTFAADVMGDERGSLQDKFNAARMLIQYGGAASAADAEDMARQRGMIETLQEEHRTAVAALRTDHTKTLDKLKADHAKTVKALQADLDAAKAKAAIRKVA